MELTHAVSRRAERGVSYHDNFVFVTVVNELVSLIERLGLKLIGSNRLLGNSLDLLDMLNLEI